MDGNQIEAIPTTIGGTPRGLRKLTELIIKENSLTSVSTNLSNLTSLEVLDLSNNNLVTMPSSLCNFFNISNNDWDIDINITYNKFCPACTAECSECNSIYESCFNSLIMEQSPDNEQNCDICGE